MKLSGIKMSSVADLGGVRRVQMHPPLAASNVFLLAYLHEYSGQFTIFSCESIK